MQDRQDQVVAVLLIVAAGALFPDQHDQPRLKACAYLTPETPETRTVDGIARRHLSDKAASSSIFANAGALVRRCFLMHRRLSL